MHLGVDLADGWVTAASPHQPLSLQPVSMLTMSPSTSFRRPGMPCTTSSLIEIQVTAGKGTLPGTPLNSGTAASLVKKILHGGIDLGGGHPGPKHERGQLMRLPDQQPGLAHQGDFPGRPKDLHAESSTDLGLRSCGFGSWYRN